jgi:DNA-3-methyladenine glycosylase
VGSAQRTRSTSRSLGAEFFDRSVHRVARDLIGCTVVHGETAGVIVEAESYHGDDEACHAFNGRTERNSVLFGPPARAYVYFSYGMHNCLNFVAEREGQAAAVLIRALEPSGGLELMRARRGLEPVEQLCSGPGKLTQALGVGLELNGASLVEGPLQVLPRSDGWQRPKVLTAPRVGISRATDLPWRFCAAGSRCLSRPVPGAERRASPSRRGG